MILSESVFREDEKAIYKLRELYRSYGYSNYRVSKFEEYDLYAKNKSFLISENLLTFTDTNGKLMALKPDVTLSIIKNAVADDKTSYKLYYDEHVYRTTSSGDGFREILQTGLESIGNADIYSECEVIMLAMKSLRSISEDCILDISHMQLLEGLLENCGIKSEDMPEIFALIESKNVPALRGVCERKGVSADNTEALCRVTSMYLNMAEGMAEIKSLVCGEKMTAAFGELSTVYEIMKACGCADKLYLDFSVVNDMNYYDGIIFKGFVYGIHDSILSGGRYDRLMERFGKRTSAIGFAVYLDRLERLESTESEYDVDTMIVYGPETDAEDIAAITEKCLKNGTVRVSNVLDASIRYKKLVTLD